jgi:hypothetical protein
MFKKNESYKQYDLFGVNDSLSNNQRLMLKSSIEHSFFINIFSKINEKDFDVLYSTKKSRPNVPVNQLVGALILKHLYNWTYQQLFMNLNFNILTRHALGVQNLGGCIFAEASIFNFQNKVIEYYVQSGHDLLTAVFDNLTAAQLKEFGIKTDIQRGDSFLLGSNIFDYTRLQLLIEVLLRFFRVLDDEDKEKYLELLSVYTRQTAGQYIYKLEKNDLPKEIQQLAHIYHKLYVHLEEKYKDVAVFSIFKRVYSEHFVVIENRVEVLPTKELHSGILFSPDDAEATYRYKRGFFSKGYNGHISETANPENQFNLITDLTVTPNNEDDAKILENRLPYMVEKTPDLSEYHADGKYGSPKLDIIAKDNSIMLVQTAVRGRKSESKVILEKDESGDFWVSCSQGQRVKGEITTNTEGDRHGRAVFYEDKCKLCPYQNKCLARPVGGKRKEKKRIWYFNEIKIMSHQRSQNIYKIPEERRKLRSNVEATIKEVKRGIKNGKSRLRGLIRNSFYLTLTSISVNLTRIHKYGFINELFCCFYQLMQDLIPRTMPILIVHDPVWIKGTTDGGVYRRSKCCF